MSLLSRFRKPRVDVQAAQDALFNRHRPAGAWKPSRKKADRGDLVVGALGVALGLTCALFPWYIFLNQEKFGVREFVFQERDGVDTPADFALQRNLAVKPFATGDVPKMDLDLFPTATLRPADEPARAAPLSEQPFPADLVSYRLVHVANGRAMIEDADGLWVVQPGSRLPDASRVSIIEKRDGHWVMVTSNDRVLELTP